MTFLTHKISLCLKNPEKRGKENAPVETGMTCSCESASQPNLPDVILNDSKDTDNTKNDAEV